MAIARDTFTNGVGTTSASSMSWSHTCTGSNLILFVDVYVQNNFTISGITYNSVAMTQAAVTGPQATNRVYTFYLVNPSTGANTITVTATGTNFLMAMATSYTGASQTGQPDAFNSHSTAASSTSESISVTTVANNSWIHGVFVGDNAGTFTGTGSFTKLYQGTGGPTSAGGWNGFSMMDTNGAITPAGATTVGATTSSAGGDTFIIGVSFSPAVLTTSNPDIRAYFYA